MADSISARSPMRAVSWMRTGSLPSRNVINDFVFTHWMMCHMYLSSSSVSLWLPPSPLGKANWINSSSYTTENIINPQFRKLHFRISSSKKPSPAEKVARLAATDEEDTLMTHKSLFWQITNVKKEQWDKKVGATISRPRTSDARPICFKHRP